MDSWRHMQNAKALLSGGMAGAASAAWDMLNDPATMQALDDYGWDDFMKGDLPPPFDFLNPPADWPDGLAPVSQSGVFGGQAAGTMASDGNYYAWSLPPGGNIGYQVIRGDGTLSRIFERGYPAFWDPQFYTTPGGARPVSDPTWGTVGVGARAGWNLWEDRPLFGNKTAAVSMDLIEAGPHPAARWMWSGAVGRSPVRADALAQVASVPSRTVSYFQTSAGVKLVPRPRAVAPAYKPVWYTWGQVDYANLLKQVAGLQVRDHVTEDDYLGAEPGGKVIIPPKGPVIVTPGNPVPHPPGAGTKEKKARVGAGLLRVAQSLFHGVTEYGDAVEALYDAIPKRYQCKAKGLVGKSLCVFSHLDKIDVGDAIVNLAWNQFEDWLLGKGLFGLNAKAAKARGDRYGFRTLNSVNGLGGLEDLGALYGEFSKEYVNPRKEDLKRFLTQRFGI